MKACVFTLGCKVNEVESASVMAALRDMGAEVTDGLCPADVYVLNTCAVTREAEKKSRQLVARVRRFDPEAEIFVVGCASGKDAAAFARKGVRYVGGARGKNRLIAALAEKFGGTYACTDNVYGYEELPEPVQPRTRAFIKIEDGCTNFCSYCIIPYLRGRVRSRAPEDIVREAENCGREEVVLTGINISAYDFGGVRLAGLVRMLSGVRRRVRLGSVECTVIDEELLGALKGLKDFAPQFHLSLQSGSDGVLKRMNRRYTRAQYLEKCALIYGAFPDAAITTDIIAGFPGESEEDFALSLSVIEEAGLSRVHAFAFSPREGTAAYAMQDVPADVKKERLHRLLAAGKRAAERFISARLGCLREVIFEDREGEYTAGYTPEYIKAYAKGDFRGAVKTVRLIAPYLDGALCEVVEN